MDTLSQILVVDDDSEIRSLLADYLNTHGFNALTVANGAEMHKSLKNSHVDLIVLDLSLPGEDGLMICRNLRMTSTVPVIMLTARGEPIDRILGLEMGADDYLAKPFEPRELCARVRSVLRRAQVKPDNTSVLETRFIIFSHWKLDVIARHLVNQDNVIVTLSGAEFRMLKVFLENPNRILTREQLQGLTQGREIDSFDRSIDLQISRLRQKLGDDARTPTMIKTIRNEGYVLAMQVRKESDA